MKIEVPCTKWFKRASVAPIKGNITNKVFEHMGIAFKHKFTADKYVITKNR